MIGLIILTLLVSVAWLVFGQLVGLEGDEPQYWSDLKRHTILGGPIGFLIAMACIIIHKTEDSKFVRNLLGK